MTVAGRRVAIVLVMLVVAMGLASGLLLSLEPGPYWSAPPRLANVAAVEDRVAEVWAVVPEGRLARWEAIAIHFSGQTYGSARVLDLLHRREGLGELGYHMVIGNGTDSGDGELEIGPRWQRQEGGISQGDERWGGQKVIDICLVGDGVKRGPTAAQMRELVRVVRELQRKLGIEASGVYVYMDAASGRGRMFPVAWFRQQLLESQ